MVDLNFLLFYWHRKGVMSLGFISIALFVNGKIIDSEQIDSIFRKNETLVLSYKNGEGCTSYELSDCYREDKDYFLAFTYGKSLPWQEEIYDEATAEKLENPRSKSQVELNSQFFVYCVKGDNKFYISSSHRINLFVDFVAFRLCIDPDAIESRICENFEEFCSKLKTIKEIEFTKYEDCLFDVSTTEKWIDGLPELEEISEIGTAKIVGVRVEYDTNNLGFIRSMQKLVNSWRKGEKGSVGSIVIKGESQEEYSNIFNVDSMSQKVCINVTQKENKQYDSRDVFYKVRSALK